MHRRIPRLLVNIISGWSIYGLNMVISLAITPFVISRSGVSNYGIWALLGTILGWYGLLDLRLSPAMRTGERKWAGPADGGWRRCFRRSKRPAPWRA